jgi:hypothetical protein
MRYLVGTDEAGYAPNLGPLVISATVWEVPDEVGADDLYGRLDEVVAQTVAQSRDGRSCPQTRVVMADSKLIYSPGKGLRLLEAGLLSAVGLLGHRPRTWREVWRAIAPEALDQMPAIPWHAEYDRPAPSACDAEAVARSVEVLAAGMDRAGVRLLAVRSRAIFEGEFNELCDRHGSKGAALSHETLALAARAIAALPGRGDPPACQGPTAVSMVCDKHGGRNRYRGLLERHFPDDFIEVRGEGPRQSTYRFGPAGRRVDVTFRVGAETCLPAALSSMASKYLRELSMLALNDFWGQRVPQLRPTAGYPMDAKRFRAEIAEAVRALEIPERLLWRRI